MGDGCGLVTTDRTVPAEGCSKYPGEFQESGRDRRFQMSEVRFPAPGKS